MVNELAESLDPSVPQEEIDAATAEIAEQEKALEAPKVEAEGETKEEEAKVPEKPPKGFVPQGALHEERTKRKLAAQELERVRFEQEQYRQTVENRLSQMQNTWAQQNQPKVPDYEDDPVTNLKHVADATQQQLEEIRAYQQQEWSRQQAFSAQQQQKARLESAVAEDVREFIEQAPDYLDAYKDLKEKRFKQYSALGYQPEQAWQIVNQEEYQLAATAFQNGRSPAQAVYEMAMAYGYTKKEAQQVSDNAQKMETLQNGVKVAKSLGSGGAPSGKLTVDALAQMSDDDFAAAMKNGGWDRLG
jgi:hypothetical protein